MDLKQQRQREKKIRKRKKRVKQWRENCYQWIEQQKKKITVYFIDFIGEMISDSSNGWMCAFGWVHVRAENEYAKIIFLW